MTPHETGSTATPGNPPRDGTAAAHVWPPGADPGGSQRRLPPGLPGPAVRGGPRNSDRLLRWDPDHREGVWNVPKETELPG